MKSLCDSFNDNSSKVKKWLTKQVEVKEETITDWLLYRLSEENPVIKYRQFTRSEEGRKTGADWEWWFVFPNKRSFAARIQAKKLKTDADCYPGIAYARNDKLQIERLLEDCALDRMASFYAFYSAEESKYTKCGNSNDNGGVYLGEASRIRDEVILKGRKKLLPKDVLAFTNPISCLFCCPISSGPGQEIQESFRRHIEQNFPLYAGYPERRDRDEVGFRETPNYILQALDAETISVGWELEYGSNFERTNAVLIIDLRGTKNETIQLPPHEADSLRSSLFGAFFKCIYDHWPDDPDLTLWVALLDHDIILLKEAISTGANLAITDIELYERYAKISVENGCFEEWRSLFLYFNEGKK